jgi:flagellin
MLAIKNNIMAENAARQLGISYDKLAQSVERLSSGLRINSAKDDAAGLAVRELMRADIAVYRQGARNAQDGVSMLQTMEGALGQIDELLIRMKELAEQAATGSYSTEQKDVMQAEFQEMSNEIDRITSNTNFNAITLLDTDAADAVGIHIGSTETIGLDSFDMSASGLGVDATSGTKTTEINKKVVADTGTELYIAAADITAGDSLIIDFDGDPVNDIEVSLDSFAATGVTLDQLVTAINNQVLVDATAAGEDTWIMASAVGDDTTGYRLQLTAKDAGVSVFTVTDGAGGAADGFGADFDAETDFIESVTGAASGGLDITDSSAIATTLAAIDDAIVAKDNARASFGYKMNRLESTVSVLNIQAENLMTAESRVSDVDVATEMATMTRTQVLVQAGIAMLAQANAMPQMALTLLR